MAGRSEHQRGKELRHEPDYRRMVEDSLVIHYTAEVGDGLRFVYLGPRIMDFLGRPAERFMDGSISWESLVREKDAERVRQARLEKARAGQSYRLRYRVRRADGRSMRLEEYGAPVSIPGSGRLTVQGVFLVADPGRTDEDRPDQTAFLAALVETIPGPIFFKDAQGRYMGCNSAFEDFIRMPRDRIIGRSVYEIAPAELARVYDEKDRALMKGGGIQTYESSVESSDGQLRHVVFYKAVFNDHAGAPAGIVGVILDITERRQAEEELRTVQAVLEDRVRERTRELADANRELRSEVAQRKRAEESLQAGADELKNFAYSIVHDLKSPTTGIYALTRKLKKNYENSLDERGVDYCDQILRASEHVALLVEKINTYIATKEAPLNIETVSLQEVIQIVGEEFSSSLGLRSIALDRPQRDHQLLADRISVLRLFRNLVDNALKYGGEGLTRIEICCEEKPDAHILAVLDDGAGIEEGDAEKVFGLFKRNRASKNISGAGLGLAIVREIAARHNGDLWMNRLPDGRTGFYVSFAKSGLEGT